MTPQATEPAPLPTPIPSRLPSRLPSRAPSRAPSHVPSPLQANDLRIFLEVARRGRLTEAAQALQLNHTTVGRHVSALERGLERRLFNRDPGGWTLTETGLRLLSHAETVEAAVQAANEDCLLDAGQLTGSVRLVVPDGLASCLLVPALGRFRRVLGGLTVEVVTANLHGSLTSREFDLAVTIERPSTRGVSLVRLADYTLRLYGAPDYLASKPRVTTPEDLAAVHEFIWYVDVALGASTHQTLYQLVPDAVPRWQTNSISAQINAARNGLGLAFLPGYIGDTTPGLERLPGLDHGVPHRYWLVVPHNFERLARVMTMSRVLQQLVHETPGLDLPDSP